MTASNINIQAAIVGVVFLESSTRPLADKEFSSGMSAARACLEANLFHRK